MVTVAELSVPCVVLVAALVLAAVINIWRVQNPIEYDLFGYEGVMKASLIVAAIAFVVIVISLLR